MPALYGVGLTYLLQRAVRGPQSVDNVESTFFVPLWIARLSNTDRRDAQIISADGRTDRHSRE